jgi:hypothetical protein
MGTNYYWYEKPACECCGRSYEPKHIGKSSGGWCFSLHVIPEDEINDLPDWKKLWLTPGSFILDEYGRKFKSQEMKDIITNRAWTIKKPEIGGKLFDYKSNYAEPGPNGLVRHTVDKIHCIGHGNGTWDLIIGEFS